MRSKPRLWVRSKTVTHPTVRRPEPHRNAVTLPALTEAKPGLYSAMSAGKIGKAELARLNRHVSQIDGLLDLNHASRLDQLESALRAVGKHLHIDIRDAAVRKLSDGKPTYGE
jgi:antitoxin HicB